MRPLIALTLVAASLPATAAAAPIPGAAYGGGAPPTSFATNGIVRSVQLDAHITTDGTRARVRGTMSVPCNGRSLGQRFDASGLIDANGRVIAQARSLRYSGPGATNTRPRGVGIATLVFDGNVAHGTVRVRSTPRVDGKRIVCDSGFVPVQLRSVAPDAGAAGSAAPGGLYYGNAMSTWRGRITPVTLRVNGDGTRVIGALFGARLACPGKDEYLANISPPMTINSDGTFRRTERFGQKFRNATDRITVVLAGRFTATGATGTVNVTQRILFKDGTRVTCRSGTVRWDAVR